MESILQAKGPKARRSNKKRSPARFRGSSTQVAKSCALFTKESHPVVRPEGTLRLHHAAQRAFGLGGIALKPPKQREVQADEAEPSNLQGNTRVGCAITECRAHASLESGLQRTVCASGR